MRMGSHDIDELYAPAFLSFYKYLAWWWPSQAETSSRYLKQ